MSDVSSANSRGLIKSMIVIGSAQAANVAISIVRMKVLALLLGPSGVGLLSIYNSLQGMVQISAGLGMGSSGVRQIAGAREDEAELSRVRIVLFAAHGVQGVLAMIGVWLFRRQIAEWLLGDDTYAMEIGLVGIAVLIGLLSAAQTALLQGLRRIRDLGWVTVVGALAGSVAGLVAVWLYGKSGLIWFVLAQPLAAMITAYYFTRRLPKSETARLKLCEIWTIWRSMARLGIAFMLGGLAMAATLLLVRGRITQELGLDAAGLFAASWGIAMTYAGFLLGAMGKDYFPRLTEIIDDKKAALQLMNDQAQLGLAIGGPVLLLLIGLAPLAVSLLYSAEFAPAATLLQWQTVGNVFKLASWPLGFAIVAAARAKTYLFSELSFNFVFLIIVWLLLPSIGLLITAIAFLLGYVVYFATVHILARQILGFRWQALSLGLVALHAGLACALLALSLTIPFTGAISATAAAIVTGIFGLRVVLSKIGPQGRLVAPLVNAYATLGWPIRKLS